MLSTLGLGEGLIAWTTPLCLLLLPSTQVRALGEPCFALQPPCTPAPRAQGTIHLTPKLRQGRWFMP